MQLDVVIYRSPLTRFLWPHLQPVRWHSRCMCRCVNPITFRLFLAAVCVCVVVAGVIFKEASKCSWWGFPLVVSTDETWLFARSRCFFLHSWSFSLSLFESWLFFNIDWARSFHVPAPRWNNATETLWQRFNETLLCSDTVFSASSLFACLGTVSVMSYIYSESTSVFYFFNELVQQHHSRPVDDVGRLHR